MNVSAQAQITDGEILLGKVVRPYISRDQLLGAILSFEGKAETALLHIKQVAGDDPVQRLSELNIGQEIRVKLKVSLERGLRKISASEKELQRDEDVLEKLSLVNPDEVFAGKVVNVSGFGVFVDLIEGYGAGKRGLVHNKSLYGASGVTLKTFTELSAGKDVRVRILSSHIDDRGTLRIDLAMVA